MLDKMQQAARFALVMDACFTVWFYARDVSKCLRQLNVESDCRPNLSEEYELCLLAVCVFGV